MYCVQIWNDETEQICRFYWVSTFKRATKLAAAYRRITKHEVFIEQERSHYNLDDAIGY